MGATSVDFGLVVLIWVVQLIVYPGFQYYELEGLLEWHKRYTSAITFIVMPLMLGQVVSHWIEITQVFTVIKLIMLLLIGLAWVITFWYAVPLHQRITDADRTDEAIQSLIRINWYRTVLWTLVLGLQLTGL